MKLYFVLSLLLIITWNYSSAQINPGARQVALSHSDIGLADDAFSIFNNPAGLAQLNRREIGLYYSPAPFGFNQLANIYASYHEPTIIGSFAVGFMNYGFDLYKENKISIAYANNVTNNFLLGATVSYQSVSIKNYGSTGTLLVNIGGLFFIQNNLRLGFAFNNITRATYSNYKNQIPIVFSTGLSYTLESNISINTAVIKELDLPASLRFGIEYNLLNYLDLRLGVSNMPRSFSSGIGINYSFVQLDYAVFTHQDLGLTHQVGLIVHFGDNINTKTKEHNKTN